MRAAAALFDAPALGRDLPVRVQFEDLGIGDAALAALRVRAGRVRQYALRHVALAPARGERFPRDGSAGRQRGGDRPVRNGLTQEYLPRSRRTL